MNKTLLALSLCASLSVSAMAAENMVINGSTTVLPLAQLVAEKYMETNPDVAISLSGSGSGNGIKALVDGTTDIANSSRFIKLEEAKKALEKGFVPVPLAVALDALVPVVHPSNKVRDLSVEQLRDIYTGKITNWKDLGGDDAAIAVVGRDTSSGTYEVWEEKVMKKERVTPRALVVASNGAMVQTVAKNPLSIGYIGIGYKSDATAVVKVGGIEGDVKSVRDGSYSVARALYMITAGWPTGRVADLINFTMSDEGQALVEKSGFVPLR